MRYPAPLKTGSKIAVTAISSGVEAPLHPRLDHILNSLREKGYDVVEGKCLRSNDGYVSADAKTRAAEFMQFATDPDICAIIPPFGGELATEVLPLLDYDLLRKSPPKWVVGYSDISTVTTAITASCNWATVHSACLMEMLPNQSEPYTNKTLEHLAGSEMSTFEQESSERYQNYFPDWQENPFCLFDLQQPTQWKSLPTKYQYDTPLKMRGRLFGGCLDTLVNLFGTKFVDFEKFKDQYQSDGVILYLENVEFSPMGLNRSLHSMDFRGVFDGINGLLLGRSTGPADPKDMLTYEGVIQEFFADREFPVIYDLDIGHYPPNLTLVNGSLARVEFLGDGGKIFQSLVP